MLWTQQTMVFRVEASFTVSLDSFDCKCLKSLLVKEMLFFRQYFESEEQKSSKTITVYCDIVTFKWLLTYIKTGGHCDLEPSNVLSIMVSSEFLKMPFLINQCVNFFCTRIDEISGVISNIDCIQPSTWDK